MNKKIYFLLLITLLFVSGCSCSKASLIEKNEQLIQDNENLQQQINNYVDNEEIFEFYNELSNEALNSLVLVQAKTILTTRYSNGAIIANSGYYYYILVDYSEINLVGASYQVMDCMGNVYSGRIINNTLQDLAILEIDIRSHVNSIIKNISLGEITPLLAYASSVKQVNKVQLVEQIKTSTIEYDNTSYTTYFLENVNCDAGTLLINTNHQLSGIYIKSKNMFLDSNLIRDIIYSIYQLTL